MKLGVEIKDYEEVKVQDTVFKIKPLDVFTIGEIESRYEEKGKIPKDKEMLYFAEILEKAVIGWENLEDPNGKVKFSKEKIRPVVTVLFQIAYEDVMRMVQIAMKLFEQLESEKKKSKTTSNS